MNVFASVAQAAAFWLATMSSTAALERCEAANAGAPLTVFESKTAAAFCLFRKPGRCGAAEVGLGGRLDSTNVIEKPLERDPPISMDHMEFLGNTLASIAGEKAGIIKRGVPVIAPSRPTRRWR